MEKQLTQLMKNIKTYCKKIILLVIAISFACASLITVEAADHVKPFRQVALGTCTKDVQTYALGDVQYEDYGTLQNNILVLNALADAGAIEPEVLDVEVKNTEVVAQSYGLSASPVYADPSMNGYEFLGTYLTTGYCSCARCCGKTNGITASGTVARANHTIAADTGVLPFGSQIVMNGQVYTVEDRGSAIRGHRIDIYFASHQEALNYGKRYVDVYRYVGVGENSSTVVVETISETPDIKDTTTEASTEETEAATEAPTTEATTESTTEKATKMEQEISTEAPISRR